MITIEITTEKDLEIVNRLFYELDSAFIQSDSVWSSVLNLSVLFHQAMENITYRCQCGWEDLTGETVYAPHGPPFLRCPLCGSGDLALVGGNLQVDLANLGQDQDTPEPDCEDDVPDWANYYPNWGDYVAAEYPEALSPDRGW